LIPNTDDLPNTPHGEILPWQAKLSDLASNHLSRDPHFWGRGDTLAYVPSRIGYTARRISLKKASGSDEILIAPSEFRNNGQIYQVPKNVAQAAWDFMSDVMRSLYPDGDCPSDYKVSIDRLKYDQTIEELQEKIALVRDIGGGWSKLGHDIDSAMSEMVGPLNVKYVRHLLAISTMVPGVHQVVRGVNRLASRFDHSKTLPDNTHLIGGPHYDSRFVTCLASSRSNVRTDYFDGRSWKELPVTADALTIMPQKLLGRSSPISPTKHRVVLTNADGGTAPGTSELARDVSNISFVLGAFK